MIDPVAIPQWLKQSIGETEQHDVLYRFLAEEMVDSIDLVFVDDLENLSVQFLRGLEIMTEWLLDDDSAPVSVRFATESAVPQVFYNGSEESFCYREVEEIIAGSVASAIDIR